jgi:hypothetical protein
MAVLNGAALRESWPRGGQVTDALMPAPFTRRRGVRRVTSLAVLFTVLLAGGGRFSRGQSSDEEYRVKAAFIFHFAQLVDWPPDTPIDTESSLFLCTLGEDPFQGALESSIAGKTIGNRVLRIRHLAEAQDPRACQILFVGKGQSRRIPALVAALHNAPVLTVGETAGFAGAGGMIGFLLQDNKVRFEINLAAADSARLKIGSRLFMLALNVVRDGPDK